MSASNTHECFREFIGQRLTGLLFGVLPVDRSDIGAGTKTLIFEDGRGLTLSPHGTYWIDSAREVARGVEQRKREIANQQRELSEQLANAVVVPA